MMVCTLLCHISSKLRDFYGLLQVPQEGAIKHLPLGRFVAIHNARNTPLTVIFTKMDQILINKVLNGNVLLCLLNDAVPVIISEPFFTVISFALVESQIHRNIHGVVLIPQIADLTFVQILEIFFGFSGGGSTQSLVILYFVSRGIRGRLPRFIFRQCVKHADIIPLPSLHNRRHH